MEISLTGHAFVDWCVEDAASGQSSCQALGLYPKDESTANEIHAAFGPVPAAVRDEACEFDDGNEVCRHSASMISNDLITEVDQSIYSASLSNAKQLMAVAAKGDLPYQLGASDCVSLVETIASGIGLNTPLHALDLVNGGDLLPSTFIKDLIKTATTSSTISTPSFSYVGMTYMGVPQGNGVMTMSDGSKLDGQFYGGFPINGNISFGNGDSYVGDIQDWKEGGNGTYTFKSGDTVAGVFAQGKLLKGTVKDTAGNVLEGTWVNGQLTQGTLTTKEGSYSGSFLNDKFSGQGTLTTKEGSYSGGFLNAKFSGQGTIKFADGSRFDGTFAGGHEQGQGTYTESNGVRLTGNWNNGVLNIPQAHAYSPSGQEIPIPINFGGGGDSGDDNGTSGTINFGDDDGGVDFLSMSAATLIRMPKQSAFLPAVGSKDHRVPTSIPRSKAALSTSSITEQVGQYTDLHDFDSASGEPADFEAGRLAQGRDGNFYAESGGGGASKDGTIFRLTPAGNISIIHSLGRNEGVSPQGGLTLGIDGEFYGNAMNTVFKVTSSGKLTVLHAFTNSDHNELPEGALVLDSDGNLYGGTYSTSSNIYEITPSGAFNVVKTLTDSDGYLGTQLSLGSDGNLYGGTFEGGPYGGGTVYRLTPDHTLTVLHNFGGMEGSFVDSGVVQTASGALYGAAGSGGAGYGGTIYSLTLSGAYTLLHDLNGPKDGSGPKGQLLLASDGNLYGVASSGGSGNVGTVFRITPDGAYSLIHNFDCSLGCEPREQLTQGTNGLLYGLANRGGAHTGGAFYSLDLHLPAFAEVVPTAARQGTTVGILGQGFTQSSVVKFGGVQAVSTVVEGSTFISATIPPKALSGSVTISTGSTTLSSNRPFEVRPTISRFIPASGSVAASVIITGTGFTQTTRVAFGDHAALFTVNSDTQITATVPTGASAGNIEVTTKGGTVQSVTGFKVN